jgi:hypothetical protein
MIAGTALKDGFRSIYYNPLLLLVEIIWRWSFGTFALMLLALVASKFLHSVPITDQEMQQLSSMAPPMMADGMADILVSSGPTLLRLTLTMLPILTVAWIFFATLGRAAVLGRVAPSFARPKLLTNVMLHGWRGMLTLLASVACGMVIVGAGMTGAYLSHSGAPNILGVAGVLFPGLLLVAAIWSVLNWYFSVALLFADNGEGALAAIKHSWHFSREYRGEMAQIAVVIGALRVLWVCFITIISVATVVIFSSAPAVAALCLTVLTLVYLAISDWLYLGRLCAYAQLAAQSRDHVAAASATTPV